MAGYITAADLGIDPASGTESEVFKWFLASFLFGKRIQQEVAKNTYEAFMKHRRDSVRKIRNCSWQEVVDILDEGHYVRYDESTARNMLDWAGVLTTEYGSKVTNVYAAAGSSRDLRKRLQALGGVGPKTTEIFMRELGDVWTF